MPVIGIGSPDDPIRPKYGIASNAVLVYRGAKVYIDLPNQDVRIELTKQPGVRPLASNEAQELEESMPFSIPSLAPHPAYSYKGFLRLGDAVAWLTHKMGLYECPGCRRRREWLNKVVIWGWWKR